MKAVDIGLIVLLAIVVFFALRSIVRRKGKCSCCSNCSECSKSNCSCNKNDKD